MKKISLIIATYNAEKTLLRCLDSIITQKSDEIELIIIDGASQDNTISIINDYSQVVDYHISEPDNGIYDAWNKGVKAATGDWIMFLGADDLLLPHFFSTYLSLIASKDMSKYDIISAKSKLVNNKGVYLRSFGKNYDWTSFRKVMDISHGSTLHNRKLFDEIGYFDTNIKICADYDFLLRKKMNAYFLDKEMIVMQVGGMSYSYQGLKDAFKVRKKNNSVLLVYNYIIWIRGIIGFSFKSVFD